MLVVATQWIGGGYRVGFTNVPDEAAHFVTGLMVRDYIAQGFPAAPMQFARNYYLHYPEIAFGHWPPWFYMMQAGWTLIFPASRASLLLLMAACTASVAAALHATARDWLSPAAGLLSGALFVLLPITQFYDSILMAEVPLALFGFLALLALVRLFEAETVASAIWFGLLSSATILTKGSGWMLVLVVPLALLLSGQSRRRFGLLWGRLGLSTATIAVLCVPFYALTLRMAQAGMEHRTLTWRSIRDSLYAYGESFWQILGAGLLVAAACGFVGMFFLPVRGRSLAPRWAVMVAVIPATIALETAVLSRPEPRKLFLILPPVLLLAAAGIHWIATRPWFGAVPIRTREPFLAVVLVALFAGQRFSIPEHAPSGIEDAAQCLLARADSGDRVILVASMVPGAEGALIAEIAAREAHRPHRFVLRASKLLLHSTWNGLDYQPVYTTAAAMRDALDAIPIGFLVVRTLDGVAAAPHEQTLAEMLRLYAADWETVYSRAAQQPDGTSGGRITIYRRTRNLDGQPVRVELDLTDKLGTTLRFGF